MVKMVYFAWVRERIGKSEEVIDLPPSVETVADLLSHLSRLGDNYALALDEPDVIRVAIDQEHRQHDASIGHAREIALFPPMTGG
ncbi:MAG: molybdopterin converting factor subunit 1 [Alphaproteobacteria bacterium]|nr:molybdopterin converting factor subunit 1 [Alphaproteobacteria bacterium]